jgi:SAM-dependent methyltransferase
MKKNRSFVAAARNASSVSRSPDLRELAATLSANAAALVESEPAPKADKGSAFDREESLEHAGRCLDIADQVENALASRSSRERARVLEVGIGYLSITTALRHQLGQSFDLFAVEHPGRATLASPFLRRKLEEQSIELETVDILAEPLPWPGVCFDAIVFADVIEHLSPTAVPAVLAHLVSRLAPRGRLIVTSPNLPALYRIFSLAFGRGEILDAPIPFEWAGQTYGHLRLYGRADVDILMEHLGLEIVEWKFLNFEHVYLPRDTPGRRALHWAQKHVPALAPRWATSWLATAQRKQ